MILSAVRTELALRETFTIATGSVDIDEVAHVTLEHDGPMAYGEGVPVDYWPDAQRRLRRDGAARARRARRRVRARRGMGPSRHARRPRGQHGWPRRRRRAPAAIDDAAALTGLPAGDPVRFGAGELLDAVLDALGTASNAAVTGT